MSVYSLERNHIAQILQSMNLHFPIFADLFSVKINAINEETLMIESFEIQTELDGTYCWSEKIWFPCGRNIQTPGRKPTSTKCSRVGQKNPFLEYAHKKEYFWQFSNWNMKYMPTIYNLQGYLWRNRFDKLSVYLIDAFHFLQLASRVKLIAVHWSSSNLRFSIVLILSQGILKPHQA